MSRKKLSKVRRADPFFERESTRYEFPLPSREYVSQILADEGRPLSFIELTELLDIAGSEGDDTETREQAAVDYFRWSALLQSLSAFETYRRLYRGAVNAAGVVDLMLLQAGNPRSLLTCATTAHNVLQTLSGDDSLEVVRQAGALSAHCRYARIDEILQQGLEPWLQAAMARLDRLGLVNDRLIAVHMTQLTEAEIHLCAERGVSVVHCPESNLKLASGFCPACALERAGVTLAIGRASCRERVSFLV